MAKKGVYLTLLAFFILGLYLRISGTLHGFFAFTFDQGRDFLALYDLVYNHNLSLIGPPTGIDGVFHGVWWHWLLAPIFWLWQGDPQLVVATYNFLAAGIIILAYILGKKISGYRLGLILAAIVATSPFFVGIGSQVWHPNIIPFLTALLMLCVWQFIRKRWSYVWIAAVLGLIFEFEFGYAALFLPAFLIASLIYKILPARKEVLPSLVAFFVWFVPRGIFALRHNFLQARAFVNFLVNNEQSTGLHLKGRLEERLGTLFYLFSDTFAGSIAPIGWSLLAILAISTILILFRPKFVKWRKYVGFIFTIVLFLILGASLYPNALWSYYINGTPAMLLPVAGLAINNIIRKSRATGAILVIYILIINLSPWSYFKDSWEGDHSVYKNQLAVVKEIYTRAENKPFNVSVYTPAVIDYSYHYLFNWYGQKHYGYTADRVDLQSQVFFVIEPNPAHFGLVEAWLREREGDGTIVWEKEFVGGIEVEQRVR